MPVHPLDWKRIDILIDLALEEDLGENGDITTDEVLGNIFRNFCIGK